MPPVLNVIFSFWPYARTSGWLIEFLLVGSAAFFLWNYKWAQCLPPLSLSLLLMNNNTISFCFHLCETILIILLLSEGSFSPPNKRLVILLSILWIVRTFKSNLSWNPWLLMRLALSFCSGSHLTEDKDPLFPPMTFKIKWNYLYITLY